MKLLLLLALFSPGTLTWSTLQTQTFGQHSAHPTRTCYYYVGSDNGVAAAKVYGCVESGTGQPGRWEAIVKTAVKGGRDINMEDVKYGDFASVADAQAQCQAVYDNPAANSPH